MAFEKLDEFLSQIDKQFNIQNRCCKVAKDFDIIFDKDYNFSDKRFLNMYSVSKTMTCIAAYRLIEQGGVSLDDELSKYIPEFSDMTVKTESGIVPANNKITIRHLFTMTGGFDYNLHSPSIEEAKAKNPNASTLDIIRAMAKEPLQFEPGTHYLYSLCHDILAGVVEVVSGKKFSDYVYEHIINPLGMNDTKFHTTKEIEDKMAPQFRYHNGNPKEISKNCEYRITPAYDSGGAGLVSTPEDYMKFCIAVANGGITKDGYRFIKRESLDIMRLNHLPDFAKNDFGRTPAGYGYGLGMRTMQDKSKLNAKSPVGEFGWDGAAGSYVLFDVENKISIFYGQHILECAPVYPEVHYKIRDLVYEELF